ncbi:hypothetical protein NAP1_08085 [Erythrobacter sp. NAP1]|uniref:hypothetical protein n=1 Tax=Erythrobacter sp. NAP1 TaxID=237727 RepID=UPI0000686CC0|nr:hypothetical protein [Erythrobacter sp. NAP1]EAQ30723.1 hypothetical protein NAP1_08085 [Erythrobacter sp. NAP1]
MEQALVLASIVLGVAIAFELEHLNNVLRSKAVKWHWAQPIFALFVLLTIIAYWWGAAKNSEGAITLGEFLPIMFQLVMLALLAAVSFPGQIDDDGVDLAQYYQDNRRYQWILMSLFFWSVNARWFWTLWQRGPSLPDFLAAISGDVIAGFVIFAMIFASRWWQVALGFAILSLAPVIWVGRSLG